MTQSNPGGETPYTIRTSFATSTQNDEGPDQSTLLQNPSIHTVSAQLTDFSDTAALIATLDLVVSVDTSVAHLAGALGKQVWILLPYVPDWRWLLDREDTPWYDSATLYRQPQLDDWTSVLCKVRERLSERFGICAAIS